MKRRAYIAGSLLFIAGSLLLFIQHPSPSGVLYIAGSLAFLAGTLSR